jgi:UDP-glucuronate 4-epimerase
MSILITGAAGFIGSALAIRLLEQGETIIGIDNHNNYYDPLIKEARIARHILHKENYTHFRVDLSDRHALAKVFSKYKPKRVVNLAAYASVRHSINNPLDFVNSNLVGFCHVLEECRINDVEHLVFASSSSVYGANSTMPFSEHHNVNHPLSLYAASKMSNELLAHSYSHLFGLPATGLRFFTVYGPWGRPDMALFKFTKAILAGDKIQVFNHGNHRRDFTYIDDVVDGIVCVLEKSAQNYLNWNSENPDPATSQAPWRLYNVGSNNSVELIDFIKAIEKAVGKRAKIEFLPKQLGDMSDTFADVSDLVSDFGYKPNTQIDTGVANFVAWYRDFFKC